MQEGLSRRELIGAGAAIAGVTAAAPATAATARRPNILCLVSEDCGAYHLPAFGGRATTPNIDALAAAGVRWTNTFSAAPVCAPSRTAMITGIPPESCAPAQHMRAQGSLPAALARKGWPAMLRAAGYYCTNNVKTDYNAAIDMAATWDVSSPIAHWRDRPAGAPFFAIFNPQQTHETMVVTATPLDHLADGRVPAPYIPADIVTAYMGTPTIGGPTGTDDVRIPPYLPDTPTTRADAARYLNCVNQVDAAIGARLAELEKDGLADDTIVLYYSDHAGVLPRSKRFCLDSGLHIPLIARFGRNVAHLAPAPPGSAIRTPVSSGVDLPVTILGLAGLRPERHMTGLPFAGPRRRRRRYAFAMRNRMDERYDMQRTARDSRYRYVRNYMPHVPYGQHIQFMWLQAGYREWEQRHRSGTLNETQGRFWRDKAPEELYDTRTDPDEVVNLATDPAHAGVLRRMRAALDAHMLAVQDNGFIPEGSRLEGYDASRRGGYPLRRLLLLTRKAIRRDPRYLPTLIRHLDDPSYVLRFWSALGCAMLDDRAAPARAALERRFAQDDSPHVRIAAAEALARQGVTADTVAYLGDVLLSAGDYPVRLYAVNALGNLGERARPALPRLLQAAARLDQSGAAGEPYVAEAARHTALVLLGVTVPLP